MRKFIFWFAMLFMIGIATVSAQNEPSAMSKVGSVVSNSIDSVYHDGKAVVDSVYHDGKEIVKTVYGDAKSGLAEVYPDIRSAVVSIGKAIGVAAEHVYIVLVKKYFVLGIKQAGILVVGLISFIMGLIVFFRLSKHKEELTYRMVIPIMLLIIGICVMCNVDYDEMLMGLINPEYGAINYILDYTKTIIK